MPVPATNERSNSPLLVQEITVGIENAEQSAHALRWAIRLAESVGGNARVHAIHVLRAPPASALGLPSHVPPSLEEERISAAQDELDELVRECAANSAIETDTQVLEGDPAGTLLQLAEDADLLVLGATNKGTLTGIVLGSTSLRCVSEGTVPVTIIPKNK